jgi:hypothetical protein
MRQIFSALATSLMHSIPSEEDAKGPQGVRQGWNGCIAERRIERAKQAPT